MEDVGVFYGHLVNFTATWYMLWLFSSRFGMLSQEKSGIPAMMESI
jgi:hypothetical protein